MSMMWLNRPSFGGGRTCLGFRTFSIRSAALASTSALSESGRGGFGFFAGLIIQALRRFAIVAPPFDCPLVSFEEQPPHTLPASPSAALGRRGDGLCLRREGPSRAGRCPARG